MKRLSLPNIGKFGLRLGRTKSTTAVRISMTLPILFALLLCAHTALAQTETVLYNFCSLRGTCHDGAGPLSHLTFDGAGNLYGTTNDAGGLEGSYGNVFELSPNGSGGWDETSIYTFLGEVDGAHPESSPVIFDSAGNLYGTTADGGAYGSGVVFELSPADGGWIETTLYSFTGSFSGEADLATPVSGVIMDETGNLYGTAFEGGAAGFGGVFELSPSAAGWTEQVIYAFDSRSFAAPSGLAMDGEGNIFGAAGLAVFELLPNGSGSWVPAIIHVFPGKYSGIAGTPVIDGRGDIFGTIQPETDRFPPNGIGAVYKLSRRAGKWKVQILEAWSKGVGPEAGVVLDEAGNIYGTTTYGGPGEGTVFELVANGDGYQQKVLWDFNGTDGSEPIASLILDNAGNLYGTTAVGGSIGFGTIFEVVP
jgi:uncharacterized repeat protein (TIGR03803 family)